jgi:hypothetical protein
MYHEQSPSNNLRIDKRRKRRQGAKPELERARRGGMRRKKKEGAEPCSFRVALLFIVGP